jgi:hypothetical protein
MFPKVYTAPAVARGAAALENVRSEAVDLPKKLQSGA